MSCSSTRDDEHVGVDDTEGEESQSAVSATTQLVTVPIKLPVLRPPPPEVAALFPASCGYSYTPLDSPNKIRLLKLELLESPLYSDMLPKKPRCSMHVVDLDDNPEYDALSYT
jgi:hypothetical protein